MKSSQSLPLTLAIATLLGISASAQAQSLTREQVRAQLEQSLRNADVIVGGEIGLTEREHRIQRGQLRSDATRTTREQVLAEFTEASRSGSILSHGPLMLPAFELAPHRFPARPPVFVKTRKQVHDEFEQAKRLGDAPIGGEDSLTPAMRMPGQFAAVRKNSEFALEGALPNQSAPQGGTTFR